MARRGGLFDLARREDSEVPLPNATSENWLAAGTNVVAGLLALSTVPVTGLIGVFCGAYGIALAAGVWVVRPAPRRGRLFRLLMAPLLVQAAAYVLYWFPVATHTFAGEAVPDDARLRAVTQVALAAFLAGWAPSLFLHRWARQGLLLLAVQAVAPVLGSLVWVLNWVMVSAG